MLTMKNSKNLVLGLSLGAMVAGVGCGKAAEDAAKSIDEKVTELRLNDQWGSSCQNSILDIFGLSSQTELYDLGASLTKTTTYYREDNCAQPVVSVVENGSYNLGAAQANGGYALDGRIDSTYIVAVNADGQKTLNDLQACGINDWQVGVPRDVTAKTSDNPLERCWTKAPRNFYDIVQVSGDQLKFGLNKDGKNKTTPENRPLELDQEKIYNRQ